MIAAPAINWSTYGASAAHTRVWTGTTFDGGLAQSYSRSIAGLMEYPPTYHAGTAYVATDSGNVVAFRASDGVTTWKVTVGGILADSPTVADGRVFVQGRGVGATGLSALSATTGALTWRRPGFTGESTPTPFGSWICGASTMGVVSCFGGYDGSLKWSLNLHAKVTGSLARAGGYLYAATYSGAVVKIGALHGRVVWTSHVSGAVYANVAVANGRVIVDGRDSGRVTALSATTGATLWSTALGGQVYVSPAVTTTSVYTATRPGRMVKLNVATGALQWAAQANHLIMGSPVVTGSRVWYSVMGAAFTPGQVWAFNVNGMQRAYTFATDGRYSPCIVAGSDLLLVGETHLYALVAQ